MSVLAHASVQKNICARIGAALYVIWGVLHLLASWGIHALAATIPSGLAYARMEQAAWNLAVFAVLAIVLALALNWRNDRIGYWINLIVVGVVDLGFVVLIVMPGYVPASLTSLAGPILFVIAATFSTIGLRSARPN
ncbi:hypothetical protein JIR23_22270 [Bradyrhizobium diazoefficiens]|nr:hypothetical protein [Bradyrhizobium diazoefficiens]QQN62298.1 hypothetical protein JIR23_22270 [Bradyrhizobium diazoefficiens]